MSTPLSIPNVSPSTLTSTTSTSEASSSPPPLAPSSPRSHSHSPPPSPSSHSIPPLHHAAQVNDLSFLDSYPPRSSSSSPPPPPHLDINLRDSQGITALHWSSINGHLLFTRQLLSLGADPDLRGGELSGTPLMWAARNGHLAIVHLLLLHSSDPTLTDSQSFNTLHLSVHSSSPFLVAYLLNTLQPLAVDTRDEQGHSALAWACYQGDAISVELLLASGASPTQKDDSGLTPLHWAVTKGNSACIKRIVQAGGELETRDNAGKTPRDMAIELKNFGSYKRALGELGMDEFGKMEDKPFEGEHFTRLVILGLVVVGMGIVGKSLEWSKNGWIGFGLLVGEVWGLHTVVTKVLLGVKEPSQSDRITKSNYLCSIIVASLVWVGWVGVTRFLYVSNYSTTNFLFFLTLSLCSYNFYRSIFLDPGHVPFSPNDVHLKETIERLVEEGRFNGMNFCLTCKVKRPVRSKHSYATGRCVARFDHYCPWVWNDIGVNNHRQFLLFVSSLVLGVLLFIRLSIGYFSLSPDSTTSCSLLPSPLCLASNYDTFTLSITVWAGLQLTWTIVLLGVQVWQVCKQVTTLEVSNLGRYGYMGGKPGISAPHQQGAVAKFQASQTTASSSTDHRLNSTGTSGDSDLPTSDPSSLSHAPSRTSSGSKGTFRFLLKLLGLDRFKSSSKALLHTHSSHSHGYGGGRGGGREDSPQENPFDLGTRRNCLDFWTKGGQLGVDWTDSEVEIPKGGFRSRIAAVANGVVAGGGTRESPYERVALEEV